MIKAILMDFNGVIINDEPIQMRAYQEVLKDEGVDLTEEDYYNSLGMDDRTFVSAAFERVGESIDKEAIGRITAAKTAKWRETVADAMQLPLITNILDPLWLEIREVEVEGLHHVTEPEVSLTCI